MAKKVWIAALDPDNLTSETAIISFKDPMVENTWIDTDDGESYGQLCDYKEYVLIPLEE